MALTPEQIATLKTFIDASVDPVLVQARTDGNNTGIKDFLNAPNNPIVNVWDRNVSVDRIHNTIDDTKYTPQDAPDTTQIYMNRCQAILIKQMNLQTKILGRTTIDATQPLLRTALKDATTGVPAGAGGNNVNPGGANGTNVLAACLRQKSATVAEKILSSGPQTTATTTADVLTFEGDLSLDDVRATRV